MFLCVNGLTHFNRAMKVKENLYLYIVEQIYIKKILYKFTIVKSTNVSS